MNHHETNLFNAVQKFITKTGLQMQIGYSKSLNQFLVYTPTLFQKGGNNTREFNKIQASYNKSVGIKKLYKIKSYSLFNELIDYQFFPYDIRSQREKALIEKKPLYEMMDRVYLANSYKYVTLGFIFNGNHNAVADFIKFGIDNQLNVGDLKEVEECINNPELKSCDFLDMLVLWLKKTHQLTVKIGKDSSVIVEDSNNKNILDREYYFDTKQESIGYALSQAINSLSFNKTIDMRVEIITINEKESA